MVGTNKVRLVVGLVSTAEQLALGLAELGVQRLKPEQVKVIAQANGLQGVLSGWSERAEDRGFGIWIVCRPVEGPQPWALAAAVPGRATAAAERDAQRLLGFHHWALRRQAQQLDNHLRGGGALLLVETDTDAEERAACTAMLRHASGGVQTHEITRAQGS